MSFLLIPLWYVRWHYTRAFSDIIRLWRNVLWFVWHFFSIRLLLRTLFSPWQGIREENSRRSSAEDMAANLVVNILMRIIGVFMRLFLVAVGLVVLVLVAIALPIVLITWVLLPLILALAIAATFSI